jgi:hypothetical protein
MSLLSLLSLRHSLGLLKCRWCRSVAFLAGRDTALRRQVSRARILPRAQEHDQVKSALTRRNAGQSGFFHVRRCLGYIRPFTAVRAQCLPPFSRKQAEKEGWIGELEGLDLDPEPSPADARTSPADCTSRPSPSRPTHHQTPGARVLITRARRQSRSTEVSSRSV